MKKIGLMTGVFLIFLSMTACGTVEQIMQGKIPTEVSQQESGDTAEWEKTQEPESAEESAIDPEKAGAGEAAGYSNIPVLTGGGLPFTQMTVVKTINHPDGSYYYEDMTEDGYTSIINCTFLSMREEGENPEDYAVRAAADLSQYETSDAQVRKDETYSANIGCPVYIVKYTSGTNENASSWTVFVTETMGYTYLYAFNLWNDAEDMDEIIEDIFGRLVFWERETETGDSYGVTIEDLRLLAASNGDLCAAVFLGYGTDITSFLAETDLSDYPFLWEIPEQNYVEQPGGGNEIYCIIPTDQSASLAVNEWIMDESNGFYGEPGQVLYRSEAGEPILLCANPSDVVPGTQVTIVDSAGEVLDWNPSLSLYDGTMNIPWYSPGVTDLTDYNSEPFFGWWSCGLPDSNEFVMNLNFQRTGNHMSYSCGYGNSELIAAYVGTWSVDPDFVGQPGEERVFFSMENMDDPSDTFQGVYILQRIDETHLDVRNEQGRPLCDNQEGMTYQFEWDSY